MSTRGEQATFAYNKGVDGCFLVPRKKDQWFFGRLQHNISWFVEDDCGTCLLDDGTVRTFSVKEIDAAVTKFQCICQSTKKLIRLVEKTLLTFMQQVLVRKSYVF
jgi:hypothetical protein